MKFPMYDKRSRIVSYVGLALLAAVCIAAVIYNLTDPVKRDLLMSGVFLIAIGIAAVVMVIRMRFMLSTVTLDEEGVKFEMKNSTSSMKWEEVKMVGMNRRAGRKYFFARAENPQYMFLTLKPNFISDAFIYVRNSAGLKEAIEKYWNGAVETGMKTGTGVSTGAKPLFKD